MEELEDIEEDAGLGNGGLGRLAGMDPSFLSLCPLKMLIYSFVTVTKMDRQRAHQV